MASKKLHRRQWHRLRLGIDRGTCWLTCFRSRDSYWPAPFEVMTSAVVNIGSGSHGDCNGQGISSQVGYRVILLQGQAQVDHLDLLEQITLL